MKTVLNTDNPSNRNNKLFLGESLGITNFADMKYPIFKNLYDEQLGFIWRPTEISMVKDAADIEQMNEIERFIFESNLAYQTMGDAFIGKGIEGIIGHVTNNELFLSLRVHSFFEDCIHTPSYSHIFENIYHQPVDKFHEVLETKEILDRAKLSTDKFNALLNYTGNDVRLDIVNTLAGLLALESISFYNSFLTSFFFAKNGKMSGTGSIISLIARDEHLHKSNSINILKILRKEESEGFSDLKRYIDEQLISAFTSMAEQEFDWIDYLLSKGELVGLTVHGMKSYVKFLTNKSLSEVGIKKGIFEKTANPFPWVNSFQSSSKSTQVAPQEQQLTSYVKSSKNDLDDMKFDF
jgi:ribonucleotide reductase beta subunit family protein with ferritin-like domain